MALPDITTLCIEIDPDTGLKVGLGLTFDPFDLGITFPGGGKLEAAMEDAQMVPRRLMAQLNPALMPLTPLFDLVDALLLAKKVFDAVKTLNAAKIAAVLPDFAKAVDKLKALVPQVSIPLMILNIIDALLALIQLLKLDLQAMVDFQLKLDAADLRAAELGSADLAFITLCGRNQLEAALSVFGKKAAPLNRLIGMLNLLGGIAGLPEIPGLSLSGSASAQLAALDELAAALGRVRAAIPV